MIKIPFNKVQQYRPIIPYGQWVRVNGDKVLFNRSYTPFAIKTSDGDVELCDRFWVKNIHKTEHFWDDRSSPWKEPDTLQKCCEILDAWGIVIATRLEPGKVSHTVFYHDDWCAQLNGKGTCNCEPDIEFDADPSTIYGGGVA